MRHCSVQQSATHKTLDKKNNLKHISKNTLYSKKTTTPKGKHQKCFLNTPNPRL